MSVQKNELRDQLKQTRLSLSDAEYVLKSRAIVESLKELYDWSKISSLHYYEPIKVLLEPDIGEYVRFLEEYYPNLSLTTTRLINDEWRMVLAKGTTMPEEFDVILVPMLGFDTSLNRLGYGAGYYDRFLADQTKAKTIGINFEIGKVEAIEVEPHDIPLLAVVTESEVYGLKDLN